MRPFMMTSELSKPTTCDRKPAAWLVDSPVKTLDLNRVLIPYGVRAFRSARGTTHALDKPAEGVSRAGKQEGLGHKQTCLIDDLIRIVDESAV